MPFNKETKPNQTQPAIQTDRKHKRAEDQL